MIVFDLDNTLADAEHRSHLARDKKWNEFHAQAAQDKPVRNIRRLFIALYQDGEDVVILTGRPKKYEALTLKWLDSIGIEANFLLMRPNDNFKRDFEFKSEALAWLCKSKMLTPADIILFEDRDTVVKALRAEGYTVLQVRESLY